MRKLKTLLMLLFTLGLAVLLSTAALADDAASGTCGENVTWALEGGVLTISGTGEMEDYLHSDYVPWHSQRESITAIVIENGITSISWAAFCECSNLTSVTIPDSVTSIGGSAFYGCTSLTNVTISDNVIYIGSGAFSGCSSLTDILVSVENTVYTVENGVLFDKDETELICYPAGKTETAYEIPNGVISIESHVFLNCNSLMSVTIPASVTSIGVGAFSGCTNLTSVTIPDSIIYIGESAFYGCSSLANVVIPDSVTSISKSAFNRCSSLTNVTIPDSVVSIGYAAFVWCSNLTSVAIPDSVTSIGEGAFWGCTSLTDVYYGGSEDDWSAIEFGEHNEYLTSATIHYNSTGAEDEPDESTPGDLNGDGKVNAGDLTILARHVGKVETMEDETALANADVTGDGNVDASDLTKLAQYVGKIISSLD